MLKTHDGEVLPFGWNYSNCGQYESYFTNISFGGKISIWKIDNPLIDLKKGWRFAIDKGSYRVILKGDSKATALEAIDEAMELNEALPE